MLTSVLRSIITYLETLRPFLMLMSVLRSTATHLESFPDVDECVAHPGEELVETNHLLN